MAGKVFVVALVAVSSVISAPAPAPEHNPCICQTDINGPEVQGIWNFLKDVEPETIVHPIIAGELSPNVPCGNCLEYNRKKRKIFPDPADSTTEKNVDVEVEEQSKPEGDPNWPCALGMIRVSNWCVPEDLFD